MNVSVTRSCDQSGAVSDCTQSPLTAGKKVSHLVCHGIHPQLQGFLSLLIPMASGLRVHVSPIFLTNPSGTGLRVHVSPTFLANLTL